MQGLPPNPDPSVGTLTSINGASARIEYGTPGLKRWGGLVFEEFLTDLQGTRGIAVFDEMRRNDPVIGSMLRATIDILKTVNWTPEGDHKKTNQFLDDCLNDMSQPFGAVMNDILTVVPFGWSICEQTFKERHGTDGTPSSNFDDGRIGWDRISLRAQDSLFMWEFAPNGDPMVMIQRAIPDYVDRRIPLSKCLHFRTDTEKNNPEGISMLRPCYRPWFFKKSLEEVEAIGIERDFTGLMWVDMPRDATVADWAAAKAITERSKVDEQAGITTRKGNASDGRNDWSIQLLSSPGSKQIDVSKAIQRYADEMATAFLAQFLRLGQASASGGSSARGSYALSRSHKDLFYTALTNIIDMIADEFNRKAIPMLMRLNGVKREWWPRLDHGQIAPREIDTLMVAVESFTKSGYLTPTKKDENFIREELDFPDFDEASAKPVDKPSAPSPSAPIDESYSKNAAAGAGATGAAAGPARTRTAGGNGGGAGEPGVGAQQEGTKTPGRVLANEDSDG